MFVGIPDGNSFVIGDQRYTGITVAAGVGICQAKKSVGHMTVEASIIGKEMIRFDVLNIMSLINNRMRAMYCNVLLRILRT